MKFVIDRSKWVCGMHGSANKRGKGSSMMVNHQGFMCCLGQVACQLGADPEQMKGCGGPGSVATLKPKAAEKLLGTLIDSLHRESNLFSEIAMGINDGPGSPEERESMLTAHFKANGHSIEFTGEYVTP